MSSLKNSGEAHQRVRQAIQAMREGRMVILVDDEDRENEGDLCMAADKVTPAAINFMARYGRGLICLTLTPEKVDALKLPLMSYGPSDVASAPVRRTAFTVSIEAREGVTTGISAHDRAHTILTAVQPNAVPEDVVSPGHIFPLRARPGGVLQRTGHTEGSVDLAKLAGLSPAGVICEIMNDDGTMARMPDLQRFASEHDLMVLTIADLVDYRMQTERLVSLISQHSGVYLDDSKHAWTVHVFQTFASDRHRQSQQVIALSLGDVSSHPCLVRVHTTSLIRDVLHLGPEKDLLSQSIHRMQHEGQGVIVLFPLTASPEDDLKKYLDNHAPPAPKNAESELREYGFGAQILRHLGVTQLRILTKHPRKIIGLDGYGLEVIEQLSP